MNKPIITCAIPVYNQGRYIAEAIESVLDQTYKKYELIVINGASTDNTEKVIFKYKKYLTYIYTQYGYLQQKLNIGWRAGTGRYLTWLCSDDKYKKDYLKKMIYRAFESQADVVYTGFERQRDHKRAVHGYDALSDRELLNFQEWGGYIKLLGNNVCGYFTLIKRPYFEKVNGLNDIVFTEWDYFIRLAEAGAKFEFLKDRPAIARVHNASDSNRIKISTDGIIGSQAVWRAALDRREALNESAALDQKLKDIRYKLAVNPEAKNG